MGEEERRDGEGGSEAHTKSQQIHKMSDQQTFHLPIYISLFGCISICLFLYYLLIYVGDRG